MSIALEFVQGLQYGFSMGKVDWDLAGLTDGLSRLGKKVGGAAILVPPRIDLDLRTDELVYSLEGGAHESAIVEPEPVILDQFVRLWRGKPEAFLGFARSWGVLGLDNTYHATAVGLQLLHNVRPDSRCRPNVHTRTAREYREPLAHWRYYSHQANMALNIVAALNQKRVGALGNWEALQGLGTPPKDFFGDFRARFGPDFAERESRAFDSVAKPGTVKDNTEDARFFIACEAKKWLRLGNVGLGVLPAERSIFRIFIDCDYCLLGAIALQLVLTMAATESFFTCSGCGLPYVRTKKRPKPGESNFCESCNESRVALRNADRARRGRIQQARQLRADGLSISEIAKKVGARNVSTIRRWIQKGK